MYGCTDLLACNYSQSVVIDDGSCNYSDDCSECNTLVTQLECMDVDGCMWMGDHCMESNDDCMGNDNQLDCMNDEGCYWIKLWVEDKFGEIKVLKKDEIGKPQFKIPDDVLTN